MHPALRKTQFAAGRRGVATGRGRFTRLIAALYNPLRRRTQGFIDHRFYSRKYDARKTLVAFSFKLRDQTNLDALSDELVGVVRETMQPAHVSLWLRPETASKGEQAN